jgi:hypothetical protein
MFVSFLFFDFLSELPGSVEEKEESSKCKQYIVSSTQRALWRAKRNTFKSRSNRLKTVIPNFNRTEESR